MQFWGAIGIGVGVFAILLFAVPLASSYYQTRETAEKSDSKKQHPTNPYNISPNVVGTVVIVPDHEASHANTDGYERAKKAPEPLGFWDAKATDLALVLFTYCLVVVGWTALKSGELTARSLDRAHVRIIATSENLPIGISSSMFPTLVHPKTITLVYYFVNGGRTVASINSARCSAKFSENVPENPPYLSAELLTDAPELLLPSAPSDDINERTCHCDRMLDQALAGKLVRGEQRVFFYGSISYTDVFDDEHETGWCFRSERNGIMRRWGGAKYNYQT
jgi:hypothetical protein